MAPLPASRRPKSMFNAMEWALIVATLLLVLMVVLAVA